MALGVDAQPDKNKRAERMSKLGMRKEYLAVGQLGKGNRSDWHLAHSPNLKLTPCLDSALFPLFSRSGEVASFKQDS